MHYTNKLYKIAKLYIKRADEAPKTQQFGTVELFFGNEANQYKFHDAVCKDDSPAYKILLAYYTKNNGAACSLSLDTNATPDVAAKWILTVQPETLKSAISNALNVTFKQIMNNVSMQAKEQQADASAKKGNGSGQLHIADIYLEQ